MKGFWHRYKMSISAFIQIPIGYTLAVMKRGYTWFFSWDVDDEEVF